jgi:hypothetical protein
VANSPSNGTASRFISRSLPSKTVVPVYLGAQAVPRNRLKGGWLGQLHLLLIRIAHNRLAQGVFGAALGRSRQTQECGLRIGDCGLGVVGEDKVGDGGFAFGDGACFVEDDGRDFLPFLEGGTVFEENAMLRPFAHADHNRGGGGQPHGAGAGDDEHGR